MEEFSTMENLDLEERRRRNIERNQKYFDQLFATLSQVNNLEPTPQKHLNEGEKGDEVEEMEATAELENVLALFPSFKVQALRISSFIDSLLLKVRIEQLVHFNLNFLHLGTLGGYSDTMAWW